MSNQKLYVVYNGAMPTTAAIPTVTTGTSIKTMLQLAPKGSNGAPNMYAVRWGISFTGSAAATPVQCELIETDVAATVTASAAADIMPYNDYNAIGASNFLTLSTTGTGYTSTSEGSTTATRVADYQNVAPTNQFIYDWVLGNEFALTPGKFLRIRCTTSTAVTATCYIVFGL